MDHQPHGKNECTPEDRCECRQTQRLARRDFMKMAGAAAACASGGAKLVFAQPGQSFDDLIPPEKRLDPDWVRSLFAKGERQVFRGQALRTIGMPCGGVAAGQLYVLGDGSLGYWWIANNSHNTGYGHHYEIDTPLGRYPVTYTPRPFTPPRPVEQGFALRVGNTVWPLNKDGFEAIGFVGEYPIAEIDYETARGGTPPVTVPAQVFSPFIPLNARDSATPCTTLRYTVTNASDQSQDVAIGGWLQNSSVKIQESGFC